MWCCPWFPFQLYRNFRSNLYIVLCNVRNASTKRRLLRSTNALEHDRRMRRRLWREINCMLLLWVSYNVTTLNKLSEIYLHLERRNNWVAKKIKLKKRVALDLWRSFHSNCTEESLMKENVKIDEDKNLNEKHQKHSEQKVVSKLNSERLEGSLKRLEIFCGINWNRYLIKQLIKFHTNRQGKERWHQIEHATPTLSGTDN